MKLFVLGYIATAFTVITNCNLSRLLYRAGDLLSGGRYIAPRILTPKLLEKDGEVKIEMPPRRKICARMTPRRASLLLELQAGSLSTIFFRSDMTCRRRLPMTIVKNYFLWRTTRLSICHTDMPPRSDSQLAFMLSLGIQWLGL
jgi:hypothetical protein